MAKTNKKKQNRRVLLILLLLFATGIILSTSSYAWFTANKVVSINPIQVNVEAQNGIQISADGTNWKTIIQTTDITSVHSTTYRTSVNQLPNVLEPVSTVGAVNTDGRMEMFHGSATANTVGDFILSATQSIETESNGAASDGKFVAFDLFFRVDQTSQIYLTPNSGVTTPDATDTGIKNSTRVAFVILGNVTTGTDLATIQALNTGTSSDVHIWEPNYNEHTPSALAHARDTYGMTTVDTTAPVAYDGIKAVIPPETGVKVGEANVTNYSTLFGRVTPDYPTVSGFGDYVAVFTLNSGITKVRIYMWIEGQDIDCENDASGGNAIFNIQLSTENN